MLWPIVKGTSVFKTLNPKFNVKLSLQGNVVDAVLLKFAYEPYPEGSTGCRRDHPEKIESAKKLNYWQELAISKGKKLWDGRTMPQFAVLVEEIKEGKYRYENAPIFSWDGGIRITGESLSGMIPHGSLSGVVKNGVHELFLSTQHETRLHREEAEQPITVVQVLSVEEIDERVEELVVSKMEIVQQTAEYTGDKFSVDPGTGHFIGDDGFRVPRNFEEFWERYPHYLTNWTKKRLKKHTVDEDVEDWEMEFYTYLKYLPEMSKARTPGYNGREAGATDVIETFNPVLQYGASEKRFRNYINRCLENRFCTVMSKRSKNPICRPGNYSLAAQMDPDDFQIVDAEYVQSKSEYLTHSSNKEREQQEQRLYLGEYIAFVKEHDPSMLPVLDAMATTGTFGEAQRELNMTEQDFTRARNRLRQLKDCWQSSATVPKQRKPYRTRKTVPETV